MTYANPSQEITAYLRELDTALTRVPRDVADEIRDGITEELTSLTPDEAHVRISQLGDARRIAAEAEASSGVVPASMSKPFVGSRIYAIAAAIILAVGAFIVPLVGWAFGYVLVGLSPVWRRWEKIVAVAVPLGLSVLVAVVFSVVGHATATGSGGVWISLLPVVMSNAAVVLAICNAVVGVWLLVRALADY